MSDSSRMHGQHIEDAIESVRGRFSGMGTSVFTEGIWGGVRGVQGNPGMVSQENRRQVWEDTQLPDCVSLVLLMAMAMDAGEVRRLCVKNGLCEREEGLDPGTGLFLLHMAGHIRELGVAREVQRHFRERFPRAVSRVRACAPEEFAASLAEGAWPAPMLWAGCTDPRREMRKEAQICVHRIVWRLLAQAGQMRKGLPPPDPAKGPMKRTDGGIPAVGVRDREDSKGVFGPRPEDLEKRLGERDEEIKRLSLKLAEKERECSELRRGQSREGALRRENKKLLYELERLRARVASLEVGLPRAGEGVPSLVEDRGEGDASRESASVVSLHRPEERSGDCAHCTGRKDCTCPLEGMKVAVVGGLDRLEPEYRKAVSELGAEFLFHTGRCENGTHVLKNLVCKADIVLYITSINSHGALKAVKGVCKKTGKRFCVVQNPGVSSVYNSLVDMSA